MNANQRAIQTNIREAMIKIHGYSPDPSRPYWTPRKFYNPQHDPSLGLGKGTVSYKVKKNGNY